MHISLRAQVWNQVRNVVGNISEYGLINVAVAALEALIALTHRTIPSLRVNMPHQSRPHRTSPSSKFGKGHAIRNIARSGWIYKRNEIEAKGRMHPADLAPQR